MSEPTDESKLLTAIREAGGTAAAALPKLRERLGVLQARYAQAQQVAADTEVKIAECNGAIAVVEVLAVLDAERAKAP